MHEFAITQNILNIVLDKAEASRAKKVTRVNLVVGDLSGVERDCVQFYFDFLKKDNVAESATLDFKLVPAQLRCRDCLAEFSPQDSYWICPSCQGYNVEIIAGRECYVESIDIE